MNEETKPTLEEIVEKYRFTLWSTVNITKGKSYQYIECDDINIIINE